MHKGVVLDDKAVDFIGSMMPVLNEKQRRLFLAKISDYYGYGSAKELSQLTGVSQKTISKAKVEFKDAIVDQELVRIRTSSEASERREQEGNPSLKRIQRSGWRSKNCSTGIPSGIPRVR